MESEVKFNIFLRLLINENIIFTSNILENGANLTKSTKIP